MSSPVLAAQQGGFSEARRRRKRKAADLPARNGSSTTVESAKRCDDAWVTLRGNIALERAFDDLYVFKDATGTINVDIDHKRWNGTGLQPRRIPLEIVKVDKDWNSVEIDVKQDSCERGNPTLRKTVRFTAARWAE